jgi:Tfp pilus assembly protein PilX
MINRRRQKGMMLIVAVIFMSLISIAVIILSASVVDISTQTFIERIRVQRANLLLSAEVWLQNNTSHFIGKQPGYSFQLDTNALDIPNSSCTVTLTEHTDDSAIMLITAQIDHGQKQFTKNIAVKIELKN